MSQVTHMPTSLKVKLAWLATAFVVVWVNAAAGPPADAEGTALRVPAAAVAAVPEAGGAGAGAVEVPGGVDSSEPCVPLARGAVAEGGGVRLGVLATVEGTDVPMRVGAYAARTVWVYVALVNTGSREITYTALDVEVTDGRAYFSSVGTQPGPGPLLRFGTLRPGESVSGWRLFSVPGEAGPLRLLYSGASSV